MEQEQLVQLLKDKGFSGLDDIPKVLDALANAKADINKHKTRADTVTDLEAQLLALTEANTAREDAEKTELQKLTDKITKMEGEAATFKAEALKATRTAMLERGIAEHLGALNEQIRPFASEHLRTVLPGKEWADSDALKETIASTLESFNTLLPENLRTVPSGETAPPRTPAGIPPVGEKPVFNFNEALHPEG